MLVLNTVFLVWVAVFGLLVGSFLNVCIHRLPRGRSPATGRSHCPPCDHLIAWYDNVPLLSFLWLRGRCRHCQAAIATRYPVVESITALLALATYTHHPELVHFLLYFLFLICPLIVIVFIDLDTLTIPDVITLPGIPIAIAVSLILGPERWQTQLLHALLGLAIGGGLLLVLAWYSVRIRHKEGMGGGDIKLAAMLGAFFGPTDILLVLTLASLLGLVIGGGALLLRHQGRETPIPFGPFIALGAFFNFFFHREIWQVLLLLRHA